MDHPRLFHEEFDESSDEAIARALGNLLASMSSENPKDKLTLVICNPDHFYPLIMEHKWMIKHHCICFVSYASALMGVDPWEARKRFLPPVEDRNIMDRLRDNAEVFRKLLKASESLRSLHLLANQ
ncbi:MAG: hypothetical protein KBB54_01955 [Candidatus Pacebacteria bacterium]|nr:hypothetical protein [Candidatus Paceibacterota bacterium]MBP9818686.1 hypothetical protein [Candidatus Paceibacterota bacterium]